MADAAPSSDIPLAARARLERAEPRHSRSAPGATETIAYAIPTFDLGGKRLVHFAAFENHVGLYPTRSGMIRRIVEFRVEESGRNA